MKLSAKHMVWLFASLIVPATGLAKSAITDPGIVGSMILMAMVLVLILVLLLLRVWRMFSSLYRSKRHRDQINMEKILDQLDQKEIAYILKKHKARKFKLTGIEIGGRVPETDANGVIAEVRSDMHAFPMFDKKKISVQKLFIDPKLTKLVTAYLVSSTIWLVFGTLIGQYLGLKFLWPDLDHVAWLSFGRLRPVHTNAVFWGWASLAMLGLGHFVVARTSNCQLYSTKLAWLSLILINFSVVIGSISLMNGINNGGGEYREYTWPVMAFFAVGLFGALYNFIITISRRKTKEIYVSNWYILGACTWTLILVTIGYLPFYQDGLGETIIQGYYMHQAVGMWFMTFTLGLVYYFLPQVLNKPIYSYSLGVLAFWTQMLFYTLIGTHHFIFSPLPWSLQTVAIVFSMGMLIPVIAGTTNFIMTFRGTWSDLKTSYVLPFLLVGVVFYFIGSSQGTFQAFRYSSLVWHFNDFNVAHSHMTMYGIITFLVWGGMYYLLPRLTGSSPSEVMVGAHFWMAFIGLIIYMWSMMIGGTLRGISWLEGEPFMESVVLAVPYWLWRAIGGTMMFLSHFIFTANLIKMASRKKEKPEIETITEKYELIEA